MSQLTENQFVVDLLTTLRHERFSLRAWRRFLQRSWSMSCQTANANPSLKRSWLRVSILISLLALALSGGTLAFEGASTMSRLLPGFVLCVAWQQSDLFWHLGLNRHRGILLPSVGPANTLTWLRGLCACYLLGRLLGGVPTPSWLALAFYLCGIATDILDGPIARRTATLSKLGQVADGEADFCLHTALTVILIQNGALPLWVGLILLLRFAVPFVATLFSYFAFAHPVRFGSTVWGKFAGLAQSLYFLALLAPAPLAAFSHILNTPLLIIMLVLLIAAPSAQIAAGTRDLMTPYQ